MKKTIKNFVVSSKDLKKIAERGCRVCRNTNFRYLNSNNTAMCSNCCSIYYGVDERLLDCLGKTTSELNIYRSATIDNPGEEYKVSTTKHAYQLRKAKTSER
jgi:hypothetical protein